MSDLGSAPGRITGLGSWPGTDFAAAQRLVFGELEALPHLVELPARGIGADMIGRTAAILDGLAVDLQPAGWRLTEGSGADHRRAQALLRRDLDELEEVAQGYAGRFKIAFAGPWTLAAMLERPRGDKVLADHGARRELADSLCSGITGLIGELTRRLPELELIVQLDEPLVPRVLNGRVATASGFSKHRRVDEPELSGAWERFNTMLSGVATVVHCCSRGLPIELAHRAGFDALALPAEVLGTAEWDRLGALVERGGSVWLGAVRTDAPVAADDVPRPDRIADTVLARLRPLELGPELVERLVLTPACGLAGWDQRAALRLIRQLREAAGIVAEELQR